MYYLADDINLLQHSHVFSRIVEAQTSECNFKINGPVHKRVCTTLRMVFIMCGPHLQRQSATPKKEKHDAFGILWKG
jgi:hypothetical protein